MASAGTLNNRRRGLAGALWLLGAAVPAAAADAFVASGHPNYPPISWQSGDQIIGIGPELAGIIFKDLGIQITYKPIGNWKRVQAEAEAGHIDLILGAYRTEERQKYPAYPATAFMDDANVIWIKQGKAFPFAKWDDLIGKRGTAMAGESYGEKFDQFIKNKLSMEWVNTPAQNLQKLELGRADYYPFSLYGGQIQIKQLGFEGKIESLPEVISKESLYIAISKKSALMKYLPQLDAAIGRRLADGSVDRLVRKYVALASEQRAAP